MIIVNVKGGIGNQLYQYALARKIGMTCGCEVKLDIRSYRDYIFPHKFRLDVFNTVFEIASEEEIDAVISRTVNLKNYRSLPPYRGKGIVSQGLRYLYRKLDERWPYRKSYWNEKQFSFDKRILSPADDTYLDGYWSKFGYFNDIRGVLLNEISLKRDLETPDYRLACEAIEKSNAVSIHVRRGYAKRPEDLALFGVLPPTYYRQAIDRLREEVPEPHFYVFSDDPAWAQENLPLTDPCEFMNFGPEGDYLELMLMSRCKHNIIANSTFSWWAAWLNPHEAKRVIFPRTWYAAKNYQKFFEKGYKIPPEWTGIGA